MIEARELRVGNLIQRISNGNRCAVNWGIIRDAEQGDARDYEGIPLSNELLEKCGFTKTSDNGFNFYELSLRTEKSTNTHAFYGMELPGHTARLFVEYTVNDARGLRHIYHLHDLQNAFFAVTGEELQLNVAAFSVQPSLKVGVLKQ